MKPEPIQREHGRNTANTDVFQDAALNVEVDEANGAAPVHSKAFGKAVALIADKPHRLVFPQEPNRRLPRTVGRRGGEMRDQRLLQEVVDIEVSIHLGTARQGAAHEQAEEQSNEKCSKTEGSTTQSIGRNRLDKWNRH